MQACEDKGWEVYSGENIISLTSEYETFEKIFQMSAKTDTQAFLSICLGNNDQIITQSHRICIDNISLEIIDAPKDKN